MSKFNIGEKILKMLNKSKIVNTKESKLLKFDDFNNKEESEDKMEIEENIDVNYNFNNFSNRENDIQKPFEKKETKKLENNLTTTNNDTNSVNVNYFSTAEGTIGVIVKLTQEVFEYLHFIQKEITKGEIGPLKQDYEKWRSIKV